MKLLHNVLLTPSSNSIKVILSNPYAQQTTAIWSITDKGHDWLKENCKKDYKVINSYPVDRTYSGVGPRVVVRFECEREAAMFKLFFK